MKQIFSSNFWNTVASRLQQIIPTNLKKMIPAKFRKYLALALALVLVIVLVCCVRSCSNQETAEPVTYTVSAEGLNVHKEHDADSSVWGLLPLDLEIQVLEQVTADGIQWGRIDKIKLPDGTKVKAGWINLEYVRIPGQEPAPEIIETEPPFVETVPPSEISIPDPELGTTTMGTITAGKLNVRKGAGSQNEAFDAYYNGDRVEIQEIVNVDGTDWGFTGKGWIGMGYVRLDGTVPLNEDGTRADRDLVCDGSYRILGYGVVDLGELNVRSGPDTGFDKVATVVKGARYAYYQVQDNWVRIESGWVNTDYFYVEGTTADDAVSGTVITDELNIRTGPGTTYKSNGTHKNGDTVEILGQMGSWGYTKDGWVNMTHVQPNEPTYTTGTGIVARGLNIRQEPNADSEKVGSYKEGDTITITEVQGSWGKTDKGWINLKYINYG